MTGAAEKISNDEFSFSIMLGLSASLIQVSLNLGCTIAAKHKSSSSKQAPKRSFNAQIIAEIKGLQWIMPGFFLRDSILFIKMVRVGSKYPIETLKSACKMSKASVKGRIIFTYSLM